MRHECGCPKTCYPWVSYLSFLFTELLRFTRLELPVSRDVFIVLSFFRSYFVIFLFFRFRKSLLCVCVCVCVNSRKRCIVSKRSKHESRVLEKEISKTILLLFVNISSLCKYVWTFLIKELYPTSDVPNNILHSLWIYVGR